MNYALPLWDIPHVAISQSDATFPVHRIYCVGRNYAEHAIEMGADPVKEAPFFFCKPNDAVVPSGSVISYPSATRNFHHEVELVVALKSGGANITPEAALDLVFGYAVGVDLTRRDLQQAAKDKGRPWDVGKAFDRSAPIGNVASSFRGGHIPQAAITICGERCYEAKQRRQRYDLECAGNHRAFIWLVRIKSRRFDLYRHARRRRAVGKRR